MAQKAVIFFFISGLIMIGWAVSGFALYYTPAMTQSNWFPSIPFQKGMSYSTWGAYSFNSSQAHDDFQAMKSAGVQWVCVNIFWFQSNLTSLDIHPEQWTDSAANITAAFLYAKSIGLHVFFKPMLNLDTYTWRSFIVYSPEWMAAYTNWTVCTAEIAQNGSAEMFSIGCEMGNMQGHSADVRTLIADVRAVYHGLVTYSANWDSFWYTDWWDAADLIGVDVYPPMTTEYNATVGELQNVWNGFYYRLEALARKWDKPIIFPEIGAEALMGTNISPNDDELSTQQDIQALTNYYEAFYTSRIWTAPWFKGAYWWIWDPGYLNTNTSQMTGFVPYLPQVLNVTKQFYNAPINSIASDLIPRTFIPFGIGIACFLIVVIQQRSRKGHKKQESTSNELEMQNEVINPPSPQIDKVSSLGSPLLSSFFKSNILMGLLIGTWIYFIFLNYMLSLYSAVYSVISLGALLGQPITLIISMFLAMWLGAFFGAGILLKKKPTLLLPIALLLVLGYPLAFLGNSIQTVNIIILFNLLVLFLVTAAILSQHLNLKNVQIPVILITGFITALLLYSMTLVFDQTAIMFAAVPLMGGIVLIRPRESHLNLPNQTSDNFIAEPATIELPKSRVENVAILIALLVGILVPFGSAQYNLMNANILPIVWYIVPPLIAAVGISVGITLILRYRKHETTKRITITNVGSTRSILFSLLILGLFGIGFVIWNVDPILWDLFGGLLFIQFFILIFNLFDRSLSSNHIFHGYIFIVVLMTFFAIGFLLNGIKGLIIYGLNFLDLVNGQIVIRTNFATLPGIQIPTLVKGAITLGVAFIAGVLIIYKIIIAKRRLRLNRSND